MVFLCSFKFNIVYKIIFQVALLIDCRNHSISFKRFNFDIFITQISNLIKHLIFVSEL